MQGNLALVGVPTNRDVRDRPEGKGKVLLCPVSSTAEVPELTRKGESSGPGSSLRDASGLENRERGGGGRPNL